MQPSPSPPARLQHGASVFSLLRKFSPLKRQAFVLLLNRRIAIRKPLTFIGPRAVFVETSAVLFAA